MTDLGILRWTSNWEHYDVTLFILSAKILRTLEYLTLNVDCYRSTFNIYVSIYVSKMEPLSSRLHMLVISYQAIFVLRISAIHGAKTTKIRPPLVCFARLFSTSLSFKNLSVAFLTKWPYMLTKSSKTFQGV